ncbi:MAG: TRAP transporter substrate-binding protein [Gammaproteobacteria bacterium]|nr:TRAP transporter substrate-binding protein [Gammaproteobacteria bacterium]
MAEGPRDRSGRDRQSGMLARMALIQRVFTAFLATCLLAAAPAGAAPDFRLKLHHTLPPVAPAHHAMLVPWARKVEADSGGRLAITVYPAGQLGGQAPQLMDQVRDGVVDIVWALTGATPGRFPRIEVFEMPFLNAHPVVVNLALYDFVRRYPEEFAEYKLIAIFVHAGQALHSRVPIRRTADLRGMKFRIPSRLSGWIVEAMGAVPLGAPVSKTPELLSKGIVDGAFLPFEVVPAVKVDELVDYHITLDNPRSDRFNTQVFVIAMNLKSYRALPPDLRAVIDRNAGEETARWLGELWVENERPGLESSAASGKLSRLPPDEVAKLRDLVEKPVQARWFELVARKGLDGPVLLAEAEELIQRRLAEFSSRTAAR